MVLNVKKIKIFIQIKDFKNITKKIDNCSKTMVLNHQICIVVTHTYYLFSKDTTQLSIKSNLIFCFKRTSSIKIYILNLYIIKFSKFFVLVNRFVNFNSGKYIIY